MVTSNVRKTNTAPIQVMIMWVFTAIMVVVFAVVYTLLYFDQKGDNNVERLEAEQVANRNMMWEGLGTDQLLLSADSSAGKLATDLQIFLDPALTQSESPLLPNSLEEVRVNESDYPGVFDELGAITDTGGSGALSNEFINSYRLASAGEWEPLIEPVPTPDLGYHMHMGDWPWWMHWGFWVGIHQFVMMLIIVCVQPGWFSTANYYDKKAGGWFQDSFYKRFEFTEWYWLAGFIIAPVWFFFIAIASAVRAAKAKNEKQRAQKLELQGHAAKAIEERNRLANHPLREELMIVNQKVAALHKMRDQFPDDADIEVSYQEALAVQAELERLPEILSQQTARYIATQIRGELGGYAQQINSLLAARDEVEHM